MDGMQYDEYEYGERDWPAAIAELRTHLGRRPMRQWRHQRPMTMRSLAEMVGCTERTLWNYCRGVTEPSGAVRRNLGSLLREMRGMRQERLG